MKVLIAGIHGALRDWMVERFNREKHDVYTISGSSGRASAGKSTNYNFDLTDEKLKFVFHSIMPDIVIFLGAHDEQYDFTSEQSASMDYLAGLANLLITMSSLGVFRFIYLSSTSVYGENQNITLTEDSPKSPGDMRSLFVSEGESMCFEFKNLVGLKPVILRFSGIYGLISENAGDFCADIFDEAREHRLKADKPFKPSRERYLSPIYVSDAVDAVYRVLNERDCEAGVYNVAGKTTELSHIYKSVGKLCGIAENENNTSESGSGENVSPEELEAVNITVDCSLFSDRFGYRPIVDIDTGLERMNRSLQKRIKKEKKTVKKSRKSGLFKTLAPFIENALMFVLLAFAQIWAQDNNIVLSQVDFMILYIVIIAITFGLFQASLSILLSCGFMIIKAIGAGASIQDSLLNLGTVIRVLELFVIGTICGYSKDRMRVNLNEKNTAFEESQKELETIYEINDANVKIKQELDNRLINYQDSLAKIYTVVEKLYSLQPDSVFFSAVGVVMDVMQSKDVSIYIVTGGDFKMCRLIAKTPSSTRLYKNSIPLKDLGDLAVTLGRDEIFVNRDLKEDLPMMAAPVFSNRELVSVIMLWDIAFDNLTLYNVNRFLVISRLISSVIERAYIHTQNMRELSYLPGTNILISEAFNNALNAYKEASRDNTTSYEAILVSYIDPETGNPVGIHELADKMKSLLRVNDLIGEYPDSDTQLCVLLTNTDSENAKFVYSRFEKAGILAKGVNL